MVKVRVRVRIRVRSLSLSRYTLYLPSTLFGEVALDTSLVPRPPEVEKTAWDVLFCASATLLRARLLNFARPGNEATSTPSSSPSESD